MRRIVAIGTGERGYALPLVLLSVMVFAILGTTYLGAISHQVSVNRDLINSWQAKYVAEAGIENSLYNLKIWAQNNNQPYTTDLTQHAFGSDGNLLLPPLTNNATSPTSGNLDGPDNSAVGTYRWVVIYQSSEPTTVTADPPQTVTNNLIIESVGKAYEKTSSGATLRDSNGNPVMVTSRLRASIKVTFDPLLIPNTPVQIEFNSYDDVHSQFSWE